LCRPEPPSGEGRASLVLSFIVSATWPLSVRAIGLVELV